MNVLIRITEALAALLLTPLLSPWIYRSDWFSALVNSSAADFLIRTVHAQAYENQTLLVDLLAFLFSFLVLLLVLLLAHLGIVKVCANRVKTAP